MGKRLRAYVMALPADVLSRLASLTGYDLMLEMDTISRTHNTGLAEIESQLAAFKQAATAPPIQQDDFVEEFNLLCRVWRRRKSSSGERLRHACPTSHLCAQLVRRRSPNKRLC